jgi:predicted phage terminase large subunit-like protein
MAAPLEIIDSKRHFLFELARMEEELRQTIELECEAFTVDPEASRVRRERAKDDYRFFCETYFPHYVPTPHFSTFHEFLFARLPEVIDGKADAREVWQAPRGEAKSTYCTQLASLWCVVTGRKHLIALIMNTEEQAIEMLAAIKAELDTNPRLSMDYPEACGQGILWKATAAITANNVKIRIGGTGKKLRGMRHGPYRPDLIFLDDLENDDNVRDKAQRDKVERFVLTAVLGLAGPSGGMDVFWVGTSLHYDAAINRVSRKPGWRRQVFKSIARWPDNMALWEAWEHLYTGGDTDEEKIAAEAKAEAFYQQHEAAMEAGAIVSWPEVRPLYRLMCMRASDHDAFGQEQQNEAGNDDKAPFRTIHLWTERCNDWIFFGAIDPSLGKRGKYHDPSAILVGGFSRETMTLDVVEADICRRVPDLIIARAIELQQQYACVAWGVETVQFQEFLYTELLKRAAQAGVAFPGIAMPETVEKELRIVSLQPHVANGKIRVGRGQSVLLEQLKFWPEADHDDGPDALEKLWRLANQFGGEWAYTPVRGDRRHARVRSEHFNGWDDDDD